MNTKKYWWPPVQDFKCKKSSSISSNGAENEVDCTGATGTICGFVLSTELQTFDAKCFSSSFIFGQ